MENLYQDMLKQPHLLIAGATGSGKSVVINGLICEAVNEGKQNVGFILIDPKRVELFPYKDMTQTLIYASELQTMIQALRQSLDLIERRYIRMQKQGKRKSDEIHIYIIIDELADLMTTCKKDIQPILQRICQIGRAANVHCIAATQCPLSEVIPTPIKVNFDARLGLRTRSAQDSRNIIGVKGCETLPRYGKGIYMTPDVFEPVYIDMVEDDEIENVIRHNKKAKSIFDMFRR